MIRSSQDPAHGLPFSDGNAPGPSSSGSVSQFALDRTVGVAESSITLRPQIGHAARSSFDSTILSVGRDPAASRALQDPGPSTFGGTRHAAQSGLRGTPNPIPTPTGPTFSVLPSLRFPTIPRPFNAPVSFSSPESFQVYGGASGSIEMTLYASLVMPFMLRLN